MKRADTKLAIGLMAGVLASGQVLQGGVATAWGQVADTPAAAQAPPVTEAPPAAQAPPAAEAPHVSDVPPAPDAQKSAPARRLTAPVIVTASAAAVSLVVGISFAIDATVQHGSYTSSPDAETAKAGERSALIADVSFAATALFGLTAAALFFLRDPTPAEAAPPRAAVIDRRPRVHWSAAPALLPQGGGASLAVQF